MAVLPLLGTDAPEDRRAKKVRAATAVGKPFPAFEGRTLGGEYWNNTVFQDKVTLVSLWRIGCTWCILEMPEYDRLLDSVRSDRFQVISLAPQTMDEVQGYYSNDSTLPAVQVRMAIGGIVPRYDVLPTCATKRETDPNVLTVQCSALEDLLGVDGYPATYIVGPDGLIRHRHIGMLVDPATHRPNMAGFRATLDSLVLAL